MIHPNHKSFAEHCLEHRPELMKEWHPDNKISPYNLARSSREKVKWLCSVDSSHADWIADLLSRVYGNRGCPECGEIKRVQKFRKNLLEKRGSLADHYPKIAAQLHPTLNNFTADELLPHTSRKKVFWQCSKHEEHVWEATVSNRTSSHEGKGKTGCPHCKPQTSKREIILYCEIKYLFDNVEWRKKFDRKEVDVYVPKYNLGIEFDGGYRHKGKEERDLHKNKMLKEKGIILLRIRDFRLEKLSESDTMFKNQASHSSIIMSFLKNMRNAIELDKDDLKKVNQYIKDDKLKNFSYAKKMFGALPFPPEEVSIPVKYPHLLKEWDYEVNGDMTQDMVWPGSNMKIAWHCLKCNQKFKQAIGDRTRGSGCAYCANQRISPEYNFAVLQPELLKSWHPTKNLPLKPTEIPQSSTKSVWWICLNNPKHPPWKAMTKSRLEHKKRKGTGCNLCGIISSTKKRHKTELKEKGSVEMTHPHIAKLWHPDNKILPSEVIAGRKINIKFICQTNALHKPFTKPLNLLTINHTGCPECSPKKRSEAVMKGKISITLEDWCKKNDPGLLKEYDLDNEYKPHEISYGSGFRAKWRCKEYPRHPIYRLDIHHRTTRAENCRKCYEERQGKMAMDRTVEKKGSLAQHRPNIIKHWDESNQYAPHEVSRDSSYIAKISCPNGHVFSRKVQSLSKVRNTKCNVCYNSILVNPKVVYKDRYSTALSFYDWCKENNPELLKEYEPDNEYEPDKISYGSKYNAKWRCSNYPKHPIYRASINNRTKKYRPTNCPLCSNEKIKLRKMQLGVKNYGSLASNIPKIIEYWDEDNGFSPYDLGVRSGLNVKLLCPNKHKFTRRAQDFRKSKFTKCSKCEIKMYLL